MVDLSDTARRLVAPGMGILAADESNASADKRLESYGIATGPEMRRKDRELFLNTPGIEEYLSGAILYMETLEQAGDDGVPFTTSLSSRGILPGIKVDEGLEPFPESPKESLTNGLIGLEDRLFLYKTKHETAFTKWRATVTIEGTKLPTSRAIVENAKRLAAYAFKVQSAGMVPMLEPEVLLTGNHSRLRCREVLTETLSALFAALEGQAVDLSGVILKTAMVLSGSDSGRLDSPEEVAHDTVGALLETVPATVPGIVFLSGGQTPDQATRNLGAITQEARAKRAPWPLTFSYSRALQEEALKIWAGKDENIPAAREAFIARLAKVREAIS
jgi:fructose-bisphosphate aldolase, class I